jgi:hypothetical protein
MSLDLALGRTNRSWGRGRTTVGLSSDLPSPYIWTSEAARAEMDRIRIVFDTTNLEMNQAVVDHRLTNEEWKQWFNLYKSAHKLIDKSTFFSVWKGNIDVARQLEQEAKKWHDLVLGRGESPIGPPNRFGKPPGELGFWSWLAPALAGAAATGAVFYLLKKKT